MSKESRGGGVFKSIRLKNFKCYKDSGDVPLSPLTIIVGQNNSGKSTLLQALLLLKQTLEDRSRKAALVTSGPWIDLGSFEAIQHSQQKKEIGIKVVRDVEDPVLYNPSEDKFFLADSVDLGFKYSAKPNEIIVSSANLKLDSKSLIQIKHKGWSSDFVRDSVSQDVELSYQHFFPEITYKEFIKRKTRSKQLEKLARKLDIQCYIWEELFRTLHHIAPLRTRVPWMSVPGKRSTSELGSGGENLLRILGSTETSYDKSLLEHVNEWTSKRFGLIDKLTLKRIRELGGWSLRTSKGVNVAAMGEGISQVLPIVARTLLHIFDGRRSQECLLVEQPEIHLHPKAQSDLADLFIEFVGSGKMRQFLIETHSEHFILRVRRRIADGTLDPDMVTILIVEKEGDESTVKKLHLNGKGQFEDWPEGFFDEAYQEAMAIVEEGAKRNA